MASPQTREGEWTRFDYDHGESIWQRECPDCDLGLLLAPVRFCPRCGGCGFLTSASRPENERG